MPRGGELLLLRFCCGLTTCASSSPQPFSQPFSSSSLLTLHVHHQQLTTHYPCTIVAKHLPCFVSGVKSTTNSWNCTLQQSLVTLSGFALCCVHVLPYGARHYGVRHRLYGVKPRLCSVEPRLYSVRPTLSAFASLEWASTSADTLTTKCSLEHQSGFDQSSHDRLNSRASQLHIAQACWCSWTNLMSACQRFSQH